jgi:putative tricarboxylic transport membrane protein
MLLAGCQPPESSEGKGAEEITMNTTACIAPAAPGGGYDFTCRSAGRALVDLGLVGRDVKATNMPGGGGGVAFAHTVTQRRSDDDLLVATSLGAALQLAQGRFSQFGVEDVRWLAAIGADYGVVAVPEDSPFKSLGDLMSAWREDSSAVKVGGGSAIGGQDHMKALLLAREAGLRRQDVRYVPYEGGGAALTSLLGGFIDVQMGDASEVAGRLEAGSIRLLAVLAPERLEGGLADVPTAQEQGYDVEWTVFRGFYVPPGMSDAAYRWWLDAMKKLERSDEWAQVRAQNNLQPFFRGGEEFEAYVKAQVKEMRRLSKEFGLLQEKSANASSSSSTPSAE